jgi:GntR family transcriptional regulator
MRIRIDRGSEIPIGQQLAEQIVFLIATNALKPGEGLPSVRALGARHKISPNTVSQAYKDLVRRGWVKRHRGRKMVVARPDEPLGSPREDLDDLIDATIRTARERGYTLQELRQRARARLLLAPPDHVLILEEEAGMRRLLHEELSHMVPMTVEAAVPGTVAGNQGRVVGALVVCLLGRIRHITPLLPRGHPVLALEPSGVDAHVDLIRRLKEPSAIGVASISEEFLRIARALLAPFVGRLHTLEGVLLATNEPRDLTGLDLVFSDTVARRSLRGQRVVHYRLIADASAREIVSRIAASTD